MKASKSVIAVLGLVAFVAAIGAPSFNALIDCPSVKLAEEGSRFYVDFGADIRARFEASSTSTEVAVRGVEAFGSNESVYRAIGDGESVSVTAHELGFSGPRLEMVARRHLNENGKVQLEWIAAYHRENGTLLLSSFEGEAVRCERFSSAAAHDFIQDIAHSYEARATTLRFVGEEATARQFGL